MGIVLCWRMYFRFTWRALPALAPLLITACATTAPTHEAPPVVAPQPPQITATEAVNEGKIAEKTEEQALAEAAATTTPATPAAPATPATVVPTMAPDPAAPGRAQRYHPTDRSTQQIREQNAAAAFPLDFSQRLDHAHDVLYTWEQGMVESTDHYFADKDRPLRPVPAAPFRIGTALELVDRDTGVKPHLDVNVDISLHMPNIEQRLKLFVTSEELDGSTGRDSEDSHLRAGLRYELLRDVDFDLGIRVRVPPVAFTSVKWSREVPMGSWDFYPLVRVFLETRESLGTEAATTFDRWSGHTLLRSSTDAKWRADRNATNWSQTFIYARASEIMVPDRYGSYVSADDIGRGWGVRLEASGDTTHHVDAYETGLFYHAATPHRWLYWYVEPLVRWDRSYGWSADPGIRIGIDALFWDLARPAK
ncbi:MAG: hypothetical protein WDO12_00170 [Pseudomonadota bacterium]